MRRRSALKNTPHCGVWVSLGEWLRISRARWTTPLKTSFRVRTLARFVK